MVCFIVVAIKQADLTNFTKVHTKTNASWSNGYAYALPFVVTRRCTAAQSFNA
jgi:hypothetical protein